MSRRNDAPKTRPVELTLRERGMLRQLIRAHVEQHPLSEAVHGELSRLNAKLAHTPTEMRLAARDAAEVVAA